MIASALSVSGRETELEEWREGDGDGDVTYRLPIRWGNDMVSMLGACLHRVDDPYYFVNATPCFHRVGEDSTDFFLLIDDKDGANSVELWVTGCDILIGGTFFSVKPRKVLACYYN